MFNSSLNNPYLVKSYKNGNNWYRIYSDGWIEQGGLKSISSTSGVSINLLKPMLNSDYTVIGSFNSDGGLNNGGLDFYDKTSTNFYVKPYSADDVSWEVKGYIL